MREGWEYKKLGEVAKVVTGATPKTNIKKYWGEGHYWVTPAEINEKNVYISETERQITDAALDCTKLQLLPKGTVLLSSRAPIGKVAICGVDMYCNQGFKNCICSDELFNKFLFYFLIYNKDYLNSLGRGATFKEISKSIVEKIVIYIPPFKTQLSIASELDMITEMISKYDEQLKELDKLSQSIFYEMFGDPVENEKGWEVKKLEDVCVCITDGDHMPPPKADYGVPFVTIGNINKESRMIDFSNTYYVPREYFDKIQSTRKPQIGDVLYTVTGSYGIPIYIDYETEFCFQRHIGLLRPSESISSIFLYEWALNKRTKYQADNVATGIAQKTVSLKCLRNFDIILPPLSLQQSFARKIEAIEAMKSKVKEAKKEAETLLAARMQYWFE